MSETARTGAPFSWTARRLGTLIVVTGLVVAVLAFLPGRDSRVRSDQARCLSAVGVISCTLEDGSDLGVPLDVDWTNDSGDLNEGRPACLPPTGIGLEGPVELFWTEVEVDDRQWRQVVSVQC